MKKSSTPYSHLAIIYDKVMSHVNYKLWTRYVVKLFKYKSGGIRTIVDFSCGTGKHIEYLKSYGPWKVIGADKSLEMLYQARKNSPNTCLINGDALLPPIKTGTVDVLLMLYDSINYMPDAPSIELLFCEVKRILSPLGIFIFDVVTPQALIETFNDYFEQENWDSLAYERHSWFDAKKNLQHNDFNFTFCDKKYIEKHIQKIWTLAEWHKMISKSNLKLLAEFENFSRKRPVEESERIHFVLTEKAKND